MSDEKVDLSEFPFEAPPPGSSPFTHETCRWTKAWDTPEGREYARKKKSDAAALKAMMEIEKRHGLGHAWSDDLKGEQI